MSKDFEPSSLPELSTQPAPTPIAPAAWTDALRAAQGMWDQPVSIRRAENKFLAASEWGVKFLADVSRISITLPQEIPVSIQGPSGVGKELIARQFARLGHPFVALNMAAMPEQLISSIMFGHVRGAFTGAVDTTEGAFLLAGQGTIFLDEIGDMPMALQPVLLRVLEERTVTKVGDAKVEYPIKCRIICATNRNLEDPDFFREDLAARLMMMSFRIPSILDVRRAADLSIIGATLGLSPEEIEHIKEHHAAKLATQNVRFLKRCALNKQYFGQLTSY